MGSLWFGLAFDVGLQGFGSPLSLVLPGYPESIWESWGEKWQIGEFMYIYIYIHIYVQYIGYICIYLYITYEYQWLWVADEAKSWAASFIKAVLREAQMPPMPRLHSVARTEYWIWGVKYQYWIATNVSILHWWEKPNLTWILNVLDARHISTCLSRI